MNKLFRRFLAAVLACYAVWTLGHLAVELEDCSRREAELSRRITDAESQKQRLMAEADALSGFAEAPWRWGYISGEDLVFFDGG